ncbi:hypothetical protein BC831DRAFT_511172 [Entophlyctis helioformis]|nr:hypothetical protein BC831DRAFT_511172 [Entophlyctis helioformis]
MPKPTPTPHAPSAIAPPLACICRLGRLVHLAHIGLDLAASDAACLPLAAGFATLLAALETIAHLPSPGSLPPLPTLPLSAQNSQQSMTSLFGTHDSPYKASLLSPDAPPGALGSIAMGISASRGSSAGSGSRASVGSPTDYTGQPSAMSVLGSGDSVMMAVDLSSCRASADTVDCADMSAFSEDALGSNGQPAQTLAAYQASQAAPLKKRKREDGMVDAPPLSHSSSPSLLGGRHPFMHRPAKSMRVTTTLTSRFAQSLQVGDHDSAVPAPPLPPHHHQQQQHQQQPSPARWPSLGPMDSLTAEDEPLAYPVDTLELPSVAMMPSPVDASLSTSHADLFQPANAATDTYVSALARSHGLSAPADLAEFRNQWDTKRRELESNLSMLCTGMPSDSYDDLRLIMQNVVETAGWLSAGDFELIRQLVPSWHRVEHTLNNVMRYIQIVDDLKATVASPPAQQVLPWRVLGYPVDELDGLFAAFGGMMHRWVWVLMQRILADVGPSGTAEAAATAAGESDVMELSNAKELHGAILRAMDVLADVTDLLGASCPVPRLLESAAMQLCICFTSVSLRDISALVGHPAGSTSSSTTSLTSTRARPSTSTASKPKPTRSSDARIAHQYELLIQMLRAVRGVAAYSLGGLLPGPRLFDSHTRRSVPARGSHGSYGGYSDTHDPASMSQASSVSPQARPAMPNAGTSPVYAAGRGLLAHRSTSGLFNPPSPASSTTPCATHSVVHLPADTDTGTDAATDRGGGGDAESFARMVLESGHLLCEYAAKPRTVSPAVVTGAASAGDQLMVGVACRYVLAVYQMIEHLVGRDESDRLQRVVRHVLPDSDLADSCF